MENSGEMAELIGRAVGGDEVAASELFSRYRDRLRKMVQLRLDRRLYGRVDASDVVQEATIEASGGCPSTHSRRRWTFLCGCGS